MSGRVPVRQALRGCWPAELPDPGEAEHVGRLVEDGLERLRQIVENGRVSL